MKTNKDKLAALVSGTSTEWQKDVKWRLENKAWLEKSSKIALKILKALKSKGITQKQLAAALEVSPQQVNKIVKGQQNLTLETITKIEAELGIELISCESNAADVPKLKFSLEPARKQVVEYSKQDQILFEVNLSLNDDNYLSHAS